MNQPYTERRARPFFQYFYDQKAFSTKRETIRKLSIADPSDEFGGGLSSAAVFAPDVPRRPHSRARLVVTRLEAPGRPSPAAPW